MSSDRTSPLEVIDNGFRLGGQPFRLLGGAIHYPRVPRAAWRDRLLKLIDLGANTVETYTFWNIHEPYRDQFRFDGNLDVTAFVELAGSLGLKVIVRPGPYVCAEWDMGGLPWWLLNEPGLRLRCFNQPYLDRVGRYLDALLPRLTHLQTTQGGPIIAMQIENEYGYYGNDAKYLAWLRDAMRARGVDVQLFTSDGTFQRLTIENGGLPGTLRTANFGSRAAERFATLRNVQPAGPLVCMEYWVGWFDEWRNPTHASRAADDTAKELDDLLATPDSHAVIYMFHGGTNWGFTAGGNLSEDRLQPFVTSYDYDALLNEAGDVTPKFEACRTVVRKHAGLAPSDQAFPIAASTAYGRIKLSESVSLADALTSASPTTSAAPMSMEELGHGRGFALYRTTLPPIYRGEQLVLRGMHDWCHVRLNGRTLATWYRNDEHPTMTLDFDGESATLEILVHNLARSNFGHRMEERKGLTHNAFVGPKRHDERALFGWSQFPLPMNDASDIPFRSGTSAGDGPAYFRGTLQVAGEPTDTYLSLPGFTLGCVFVNGVNIGRYWNVGPQMTLYVHASMLRSGANEIVVFDAVGSTATSIESVDRPMLQKA